MKEMIEQALLPQVTHEQVEVELNEQEQAGKWKAYAEYKDSGAEWLGEIPEHWGRIKLKYLTRLNYGDALPSGQREDGDNLVYGSNGPVGKHSEVNTSSPVIIIGRKGSFGKITYSEKPCFAIDTTYYIDNPHKGISIRWLFYVLKLLKLDEFTEDTAIPGLSREYVYSHQLPLPSFSEQSIIATFLDHETTRINTLIAKKEQHIALLQERRTAIINQAVTKGLDADVPMKDSGVEWLGEIPKGWEVRRIRYLSSFVTSGSRGWAQYYSEYGPIFLRIGNLTKSSIGLDFNDTQHVLPPKGSEGVRTKVNENDILISITGAYIGLVGIVPGNIEDAYVNQHIALVRLHTNIVDPRWIGYCLISRFGQEQFRLSQYGGTKDGLGLDDVKDLSILTPPISEQIKILFYIEQETTKIDRLITGIQESIKKLKEYSTALISAAVTGKIDVRGEVAAGSVEDASI